MALAASGCDGGSECRFEPSAAIRGYEDISYKVESLLRQMLVFKAYQVLAAGEVEEERTLDPGVEQVRAALAEWGVDLAALPESSSDIPGWNVIVLDTTQKGSLASQVAEVMERLSGAVREHAELLPLPAAEMGEWVDDLRRGVNDAVARSLWEDSTFHAGTRVEMPNWDGGLESFRSQPRFQNLINTIGNDVVSTIQASLAAACGVTRAR